MPRYVTLKSKVTQVPPWKNAQDGKSRVYQNRRVSLVDLPINPLTITIVPLTNQCTVIKRESSRYFPGAFSSKCERKRLLIFLCISCQVVCYRRNNFDNLCSSFCVNRLIVCRNEEKRVSKLTLLNWLVSVTERRPHTWNVLRFFDWISCFSVKVKGFNARDCLINFPRVFVSSHDIFTFRFTDPRLPNSFGSFRVISSSQNFPPLL